VRSGAHRLLECLAEEGVDVLFGYPGGAVLPVYDALYDSPIRHILVRHEQGAVHAADGYARVSGRVGVCLATSGPGATNLVTGLATAHMDSSPVVAITGQVARPLIGSDAFQEVDTIGVTRAVTKHNYLVESARDIPRVVHEAFHIARSGRPGPVLIDLPKDVALERGEFPHPADRRGGAATASSGGPRPGRSRWRPRPSPGPSGPWCWSGAASSPPTWRRPCGPCSSVSTRPPPRR